MTRFAGILFFALALYAAPTKGFEAPKYPDSKEAIQRILDPLLENDRKLFHGALNDHFGESNSKQIASMVFDTFLSADGMFDYIDMMRVEKMGNTFHRNLYVLRTNKEDFLYLEFYAAKTSTGWMLHDLVVHTDLTRFLPDWEEP